MLAVARNLRMERDREEQTQKQKQEQRNLVCFNCLLVFVTLLLLQHFTALWILSGTTRLSRHQKGNTRKVKPVWIYWNKR